MSTEIEIKVRVGSHEAVRAALRTAGAAYAGSVLEVNRFFDRADGSVRAAGCGLRIRSARVIQGKGGSATITFKGPIQGGSASSGATDGSAAGGGPLTRNATPSLRNAERSLRVKGGAKRREEIEVTVEDAERMAEILGRIGFAEQVLFEKRRESWVIEECRVELDEVPELGLFVEIEGPDEASIAGVRLKIGLDAAAIIPETYLHLLTEFAAGGGPARREWMF